MRGKNCTTRNKNSASECGDGKAVARVVTAFLLLWEGNQSGAIFPPGSDGSTSVPAMLRTPLLSEAAITIATALCRRERDRPTNADQVCR